MLDVQAIDLDAARGGLLQRLDDLEGGRLAGPVGAQDAEGLSPSNLEGDAVDRYDRPEDFSKGLDPNNRVVSLLPLGQAVATAATG